MSARYEGVPQVQFLPDGRNMRLTAGLVFYDPSEIRWAVPADAVVDGASIPKFLWSVFGGPFEGRYRDGSIIHDWYCDIRTRPWQATHRVFYDAMCVSGVPPKTALIMYFAVRWKGPRWDERVMVNTNLSFSGDNRVSSSDQIRSYESAEVQITQSMHTAILSHDYSLAEIDTIAESLHILEHAYLRNPHQYTTEEVTDFINEHLLSHVNIPLEVLRTFALALSYTATGAIAMGA
jgi:hypothetical protein